jgi:hypothetical protein
MKTVPVLCSALLACAVASARPLILEPTSFFPDTAEFIGLTGNEAFLTNTLYEQADPDLPEEAVQVVKLYQRTSTGQWTYVRDIISDRSPLNQNVGYNLDVQGSVAAIALPSGLHIFERTSAGWVEASLDIPRPQSPVIAVDSNRVLAIEADAAMCAPEAVMLERGTNGHWNISAHLPAPAGACVSSFALDANAAALLSHPPSQAPGNINSTALRIFERSGSAWIQAAQFAATESDPKPYGPQLYGPVLDIHSGLALVSGSDKGMHVYRRGGSGWTENDPLKFPDAYDYAGEFARAIEITDTYVLAAGYNTNRRTDAVYLFRNQPANAFPHVALLTVAGSNGLYDAVIDGNRVLANGFGYPAIFELPASFTTPPVVQDDFEAGPGPWQILPGSQFSVVQKGPSHVWRQSSLAGNAGAVLDVDRTNQSVSAQITATAVNGNDRWVGLVTRYTDESNYYYVTIRGLTDDSERIVLKRMQNGVFTDLVSYTVATGIGLNQRIRLTLESTGDYHAVYLDNELLMRAYDGAHPHGKAGLRMYKAAAEFDNVVVTPGPLMRQSTLGPATDGGTWTSGPEGYPPGRAVQTSLEGDARAMFGTPVEDSVATAVLTIDAFNATGTPWAGLMSRYVDSANYYYVTLRKSNELSLRRVTNGVITVLGTVPLTVTPGTAYRVRMETVGDRLRVFVNDELKLERAGAQIIAGRTGVVMYRARATVSTYALFSP